MNIIEKATMINFHRHRINEFRDSVRVLGWKGDESQFKRFEVLLKLGDFSGCSILDIGCGRGDFMGFLNERIDDFSYVGLDLMSEFIIDAAERYGHLPNTKFYQGDFSLVDLPRVDFAIASGALTYRSENACYYNEMIAKLYASAKCGFAFNMLNVASFPEHPLLVGHDIGEVVKFCQMLCPRVELISDYFEDDFTVFMYRD